MGRMLARQLAALRIGTGERQPGQEHNSIAVGGSRMRVTIHPAVRERSTTRRLLATAAALSLAALASMAIVAPVRRRHRPRSPTPPPRSIRRPVEARVPRAAGVHPRRDDDRTGRHGEGTYPLYCLLHAQLGQIGELKVSKLPPTDGASGPGGASAPLGLLLAAAGIGGALRPFHDSRRPRPLSVTTRRRAATRN